MIFVYCYLFYTHTLIFLKRVYLVKQARFQDELRLSIEYYICFWRRRGGLAFDIFDIFKRFWAMPWFVLLNFSLHAMFTSDMKIAKEGE